MRGDTAGSRLKRMQNDVVNLLVEIMRVPSMWAKPAIGSQQQRDLLKLARQNKLALRLLASGAIDLEIGDLRAEKSLHHQKNAQVLALTKQVAEALMAAGVRFVIFKGPLQQYVLYSHFFEKPSGDVDVLVGRRDLDRARAALESIGLSLPYECERLWWRYLLGEQHFVQSITNRPTVDLHHRLQRPGCPSPRHTSHLLAESLYVSLGGIEVPTCSPSAIALLSTLNLIKALYDREAAGGHAMDLSVALTGLTQGERADLLDMAKQQGLLNSLLFAADIAHYIFKSPALKLPASRVPLDAALYARLALVPGSAEAKLGKDLLPALSDTLGNFARDSTRHLVGKLVRLID